MPMSRVPTSSLSFSSDLVRAMHARGSGEAKRGRFFFRASPVSRHQSRAWPLRVSRFARRTTEKRETARSLSFLLKCRHFKTD